MDKKLLIFFFFVLLSHSNIIAQSNHLVLQDALKVYQLNPYFLMLKDTLGNLGIDEVSKPSLLSRFQPLKSKSYRVEQDKGVKAYWLRLELDNQSSQFEYIFFNPPRFDTVEVYFKQENQLKRWVTGIMTKASQQDLFISVVTHVPIVLASGHNVIYFRISGTSLLHHHRGSIQGRLWQAHYAYTYHMYNVLVLGLAFGALIFLFFFNGVIYLFLKDWLYFTYLASLLMTIILMSNLLIYDIVYEALGFPFIMRYGYLPMGALNIVADAWFVQTYLKTRKDLPILHFLIDLTKYLSIFIIIFLLMGEVSWATNSLFILSFALICFILLVSILKVLKGFPQSKYFLLANAVYLLGGVMLIVMLNRWIAYQTWIYTILPVGEAFRALIFSIALADRVSYLRVELAQKEQENRLINQEKELQLLRLKDRIQRDLHDNFGWLLTLLVNQIDKLSLKPQDISEQKINELADLTRQIIQELRHTLWIIKEENLTLSTLEHKTRDLIWQLKPLIQDIQFEFMSDYPPELQIKSAHGRHLFSITQESIHNSLKYSQASKIEIQLKVNPEQVLSLKIKDNGVGFDINRLSSPHRIQYGLKNMHKRAKDMGASIEINSIQHKGTSICVYLPLVEESSEYRN